MRHFLYSLLAVALLPQVPAVAQPPPGYGAPPLAAAIADGAPFVDRLDPGANIGSLIGGETYSGQFDPGSGVFTVSGPGRRPDGFVVPQTASYGGADPRNRQLSLWGALFAFDAQGNLFLSTSGRRAG